MNQFEFSYILSVHGNAALPTLKKYEPTKYQANILNLATEYYIDVIARKKLPHPLADVRLGNYHEGWAGLIPNWYSVVYDYEEFKRISAIGHLSNIL